MPIDLAQTRTSRQEFVVEGIQAAIGLSILLG
jgi:hypothetical protein